MAAQWWFRSTAPQWWEEREAREEEGEVKEEVEKEYLSLTAAWG